VEKHMLKEEYMHFSVGWDESVFAYTEGVLAQR